MNDLNVQKTLLAEVVAHTVKAGAVAAFGLSLSQAALAQEVTEELVVSGIRASIQQAAEIKRESSVISDVISAEDIGKFPDQNLAESLQRISGIQISRSRGEGQNVTVRGLSPDFTRVQFNGRTLPSATGGRSFDFTILPSDFVSELNVYKTPSADMEEGAISATIDVKTVRPLDVGDTKLVTSFKLAQDDNAGEIDPDLSVLYTNVNEDGTFGFSVGAHYDKRTLESHIYEAFGLEPASEAGKGLDYNVDGDMDDSFRFNHATNFSQSQQERERTTLLGTAQWQASESLSFWAETLYSEFDVQGSLPLNSFRWTNVIGPGVTDSNISTDPLGSEGLVDFLEIDGVDNRNNARTTDSNDKLTAFSVGADIETGKWATAVELSYGESKSKMSRLAHGVIGRAHASYDLRDNPSGVPTVQYADGYDQSDVEFRSIGFNGNFDQPTEDTSLDLSVDVDYELSESTSLEFGAKYSSREKFNGFRRLAVGAEALADLLGEDFDPNIEGGSFDATNYMTEYNPSGFFDGDSGSAQYPSSWLSADVGNVLDQVSMSQLVAAGTLTEGGASEINVTEDVLAAYVKLNFSAADDRLSGNVGLRYVSTDQSSAGNIADFDTITFDQGGAVTNVDTSPSSMERSYTNVLPSLNVRYQFTEDFQMRFGAATVMSRPSLSVLSPATTINVNVGTISSSNPNVDPFLADQLDLSFEWYYSDTGMLSVAPFAKFVDSFIVSSTQDEQVTYTDLATDTQETETFTRFLPDNGSGTDLIGFEINWVQPLDVLLEGLGVAANYTSVDADDIQTSEGGPYLPIDGLSESSYNFVTYFENDLFGVRLAYNYRDGFVNNGTNYFGDGSFTDSYSQWDLSSSVNVSDNVSVVFEALNLTNEVIVQTNSLGINRGLEDTGRRVSLGVRANF